MSKLSNQLQLGAQITNPERDFNFVRREVKCVGHTLRGIRRPCQLFYDARK